MGRLARASLPLGKSSCHPDQKVNRFPVSGSSFVHKAMTTKLLIAEEVAEQLAIPGRQRIGGANFGTWWLDPVLKVGNHL